MSDKATLDKFIQTEAGPRTVNLNPTELEIPKDWGIRTIDSLSTYVTDGAHQTPKYVDNGIRFLSTKNLQPGSEEVDFSDYEKFITEKEHSELSERADPKEGDILISKSGTIGITQLVRTDLEFSIFVGLGLIRPNSELNGCFLEQLLNWRQIRKSMRARSPGSTRSTLPIFATKQLEIPYPPLQEQRKIATVLYTVDQAIDKTDKIIRQFERLHQGLFQNLIPGGIRHDEYDEVRILGRTVQIPADWEITTVSQACSDIIDYRGKNPEFSDGGIPHLRNININRGKITLDDLKYVSQETYDEWMTRGIPQKGDTLLSTEAPMGKTAVLPDLKFSLSQRLIVLSPGKQFDNHFFAHLMGSPFVQKEYEARATGSTVKGISNYNLQEVTIPVPPKNEQKQITQYIDNILEAIQKNEQQVSHLKRLKRGLMQDLLSGTVRTTDTNMEVPDEITQHG